MTKSIHQLIPDIYQLVGSTNVFTDIAASDVGTNIANAIQRSLGEQERRGLRLSGLGPTCPCALWHQVYRPDLAEPLPPYAKIKYTYGHIIEHLVIGLAKAAGHEVTGEQDEINVDGILGHRDCVIDGCVVDVKSASSRSFLKFRDKTIADVDGDPFGYLDQINSYSVGSLDDPLVRIKGYAYLLAVDKTLGHLALYQHKVNPQLTYDRIKLYKEIIALTTPPKCICGKLADGKSGNIKLDMKASYNSYKYCCNPKLRIFLYSSGPVYLTSVMRKPDVLEVDRFGNVIN